MKKKNKTILGFLGLGLVTATTAIAANLPGAGVSALSSVTDTVTVRVVGSEPNVSISGIENDADVVRAGISIDIPHSNVGTITIIITPKNEDGTLGTPIELGSFDTDYQTGSIHFEFDMNNSNLGYGDYVLSVIGEGVEGLGDEDTIEFSFTPIVAEATENEDTGEITIDLDYLPASGGEGSGEGQPGSESGDVAEIEINVYDSDGNLVESMSPITVTPPTTQVQLPFDEKGVPSGNYTIVVTARDTDGNVLSEYETSVEYRAISAPNTGGFFKNLNISKADYLITGVIAFLLVGIFGIVFIAKKQSGRKAGRRR